MIAFLIIVMCLVLLIGLYCCLVIAAQADRDIDEFMREEKLRNE